MLVYQSRLDRRRRLEKSAVGHIPYGHRFAKYCLSVKYAEYSRVTSIYLHSITNKRPCNQRTQQQARAITSGEFASQRALSVAIGRAVSDAMLASPATPSHIKDHLQLLSHSGNNAWLHAPPNDGTGLKVESE